MWTARACDFESQAFIFQRHKDTTTQRQSEREMETTMWKLECSIWREDDWYVSECKDLEIASQGRTLKEAQDNLQEAIRLFLEAASFTEVMSYLSRLESDTPAESQRNLEVLFTPIDQGDHTTLGEVTLAYA